MIYATACTALVAVLFLTNWPTYQYIARGGPIPLYYYVIPMVLIVPMMFAEPVSAVRFVREPLTWWFVFFVLSGLVWLLVAQDFIEEASAQWRLRVLSFLFFYTITMLASDSRRRTIGWVIVGCVAIACAFNWIDVLRPHRFVPQGVEGSPDGRGAGLFINPNAAGSFIVMGVIGSLGLIPARLRTLLFVGAIFGVAATFSRGAFVMITVAALGALVLKLIKRSDGLLLVVALPLLVAGVSVSYDYAIDKSENRHVKNIIQRLNWFQGEDEEDLAVEGRKFGARQAWEMFLDDPVVGKGPGATSLAVRQEGPHNMYLLLMAEQGVLGLFLYLSLVALLIRSGRRVIRSAVDEEDRDVGRALVLFGVFMATYGFFSHNVLEEPFTMFILAFLVAGGFRARARSAALRSPPARAAAVRRATSPV
jgi:O-antigen ligase